MILHTANFIKGKICLSDTKNGVFNMLKNVIFTAFANPKGDLANLTAEQNGIQDALLPLERQGKIAKHLVRTDTDLMAYFEFLREYKDQISLFHYGGHADSQGISLQNSHIFFEPLAKELVQRNPTSLQLVVLNGCCTHAHIKTLFDLKVKAVIATSVNINDNTATQFAIRFYKNLASGDALLDAYQSAANFIKADSSAQQFRGFGEVYRTADFEDMPSNTADEFPWGLYVNADDKVLDQVFFDAVKADTFPYNQLLTQQLIEAAAKYSVPIGEFLKQARAQAPNWVAQNRISNKAKEIIAFSFAGVIGVQFSKLMAIGKEHTSEAQSQKYLHKCIHLVKYGLDLLNFALIAHLWDKQTPQTPPLNSTHQDVLRNFLTSEFELSIAQRLTLFETLLGIFEENKTTLPLPELAGFLQEHLDENSPFRRAILAMQALQERLENVRDTSLDCAEAERHLAAMYVPLAFLVRYKMASIKFINYQQTKQSEPRYLHRYTALGIDSKANIDAEKIYFTTETAETDSVWLYKGGNNYKNGINLMPFALDFNALTFEHGARICFFSAQNADDATYEYIFLDDQSSKKVEWQRVNEEDRSKSEWLLENKNRIVLNFNAAIGLLHRVQKALLTDAPADASFDIDFDKIQA